MASTSRQWTGPTSHTTSSYLNFIPTFVDASPTSTQAASSEDSASTASPPDNIIPAAILLASTLLFVIITPIFLCRVLTRRWRELYSNDELLDIECDYTHPPEEEPLPKYLPRAGTPRAPTPRAGTPLAPGFRMGTPRPTMSRASTPNISLPPSYPGPPHPIDDFSEHGDISIRTLN
ncbi:hypothetical protein HDU97_007482 [Phlyctochytrium planicorne]|nr:hypothetical protein HDU97_007482 [Phlyctochytrium planicorne]